MSDPSSFLCVATQNYKIPSTITCLIYMVIGGVCMIQLLNRNLFYKYNDIFVICWTFSCSFVNGGIGLSFGLFVSGMLALLGIHKKWPFLVIPLMMMQMFLFVVMKLEFADFLIILMHEEGGVFMRAFITCTVFVILSIILGFTLWILYCAFIQISLPRRSNTRIDNEPPSTAESPQRSRPGTSKTPSSPIIPKKATNLA